MAKTKRKLTPFLCQEMLYDYAVDRLDEDRRAAVDEFLKTDKECQKILEGIRAALVFTESLGKTQLRTDIAFHVRESENAISLSRKYSSWKEWPEALRWSLTAIGVSVVVAGVVAIIPWNKIPSLRPKRSDTIEVAAIARPTDKQIEAAQEQQEMEPAAPGADEGSGDDVIDTPDVADVGKPTARPPMEGDHDEGEGPVPVSAIKPTPAPTPKSTGTPVQVAATKSAEPAKAPMSEEAETEPEKKEAKAKGFVYRAFMNLSNLDEIGPKITEHIIELGGEKAGEVELGWKRGSGRYYHFAVPEENEEKLLEKLRAYGPVRISKDPHPRVMPQGQLRFILWVDAAR